MQLGTLLGSVEAPTRIERIHVLRHHGAPRECARPAARLHSGRACSSGPCRTLAVASVSYLAVFPSILSYIFWNHAVSKVGPNTAGYFIHLVPVFGILLSVLLLGEAVHAFHLAGMVCVFSGICLTTRGKDDALNASTGRPPLAAVRDLDSRL
ncbi:MAG: DMT family transporter [Desulfobacterales bacterium]|nr:DMT family transporter [Desulfobacterales bacterium]